MTKKNETKHADLPDAIAAALSDEATTSETFRELIAKVDATVPDLVIKIGDTRTKALEPTLTSAEAEALRKNADDQGFVRDRLNAALPKLRERLTAAQEAERLARWREKVAPLHERAEAMRSEFVKTYRRAMREIVDLFDRAQALDEEIRNFNIGFNIGESFEHHNWLPGIELERLQPLLKFSARVTLPDYGGSDRASWPRPPSMEYLNAIMRFAS